MSSFVVAKKTFRDNRTTTMGVGMVVVGMAVLASVLYPTYKEALADFELPAYYQGLVGETGDISSPEGYLSAEFFSWIPLLVITMAIIGGTRAFASEEADGTMEILLAQPISRTRLMLEKALGPTIAVFIMMLVGIPGFLVGLNIAEVDIGMGKIVAGIVMTIPLVLLFLMLSLWAAAATPSRSSAVMVTVGVLVVSFVIHSMGASIEALATPRKFFPFYWADASVALIHGVQWGRVALTCAVSAGLLAGAVWSFNRRDIASGSSDWSLRRLLPGRLPLAAHRGRDSSPMEEHGA